MVGGGGGPCGGHIMGEGGRLNLPRKEVKWLTHRLIDIAIAFDASRLGIEIKSAKEATAQSKFNFLVPNKTSMVACFVRLVYKL